MSGFVHADSHFNVAAILLCNGDEALFGVFVIAQHKINPFIKKLARICQRDGMGIAVKQTDLQFSFQRGNILADGGLGYRVYCGSLRETQTLGQCNKVFDFLVEHSIGSFSDAVSCFLLLIVQ